MEKLYLLRTLGQIDQECDELENGDPCRSDVLNHIRTAVRGAIGDLTIGEPECTVYAEEVVNDATAKLKDIEVLTEKNRKLFDEVVGAPTMRSQDLINS